MLDIIYIVPAVFLLAGLVLLAVAFFIQYKSRQLQISISKLYELNQLVNQDVLDFIAQSWQTLDMFGFEGMHGSVCWFGELKEIKFGTVSNKKLHINIQEDNIKIKLFLYSPKKYAEAGGILTELMFQTFEMLLTSNVSNKSNQFLVSQQRLEKFQLFVQHDMKNIAQFITLLSSQVKLPCPTEEKVKLYDRLHVILPNISKRAKKISQPLLLQSQEFSKLSFIELNHTIEQIAKGMELKFRLQGKAKIYQSKKLIEKVFEIVLENFQAHLQYHHQVEIAIAEQENLVRIEILVFNQNPLLVAAERMFEPFWTTSQSGMGLGLFIARSLLDRIGGEIKLVQKENVFGFAVSLPKSNIRL